MRRFQGLPVSAGLAIGQAWIYRPVKVIVSQHTIRDPEEEWLRLQAAINLTRNQLQALEERARKNIGANEAEIFVAHQEFLGDVELMGKIRDVIFKQFVNAEAAVKMNYDEFAEALAGLDDPYFQARAQDLQDVANRILRCLQGQEDGDEALLTRPSIIVADDLTPSDTVQFDKEKILGICIAKGGPTSHTAILARSLGVPAIVSASFDLSEIESEILTVLDGSDGSVVFGPTLNELNLAKERQIEWTKTRAVQLASASQPAVTMDGHTVEVVANIGGVDDARKAIEMGAEGVGLFRTEFLYLDRTELLDIKDQVAIYHDVMEIMAGKPLVVRTLDIGGDKNVHYLGLTQEPNPFLGWRGIRMVRERPDILANQFQALLLAGKNTDLRIMLPMVSSVGEVQRAREIYEEVRNSLLAQGKQIAENVQFGIMVEVPSAALLADHLAEIVDFFSIGTNDLTQYTLAIDRTNERVAVLASPFNPSVLRLISMTIEAAHKRGKWVGLCGELAGETMAVPLLLGMGLDEFSMAPSSVPPVKQAIRSWSLERCKEVVKEALFLPGSSEVIKYLEGLEPS
jgi:phosphoenolpyruvate-protein phosphotransferase